MANRKYKIGFETNQDLLSKIPVDFIHNRFDLQGNDLGEFYLLQLEEQDSTIYLQLRIKGAVAQLGMEFCEIPKKAIKRIARFVFEAFPAVKQIEYKNGFVALGQEACHNYFVLQLPESIEELQGRQNAESRKKLRKRRHLVERELGEITFEEYDREHIPLGAINRFFEFKNMTHQREYGMTEVGYLANYYVTHLYVLKINGEVEALRLTCEQCDGVYAENHSYNPVYGKYRLGQLLYDHVLTRLVEKGKKTFYLSGGDYDYKRHYGSQELQVFDCVISRFPSKRLIAFLKRQYRCLKRKLEMRRVN